MLWFLSNMNMQDKTKKYIYILYIQRAASFNLFRAIRSDAFEVADEDEGRLNHSNILKALKKEKGSGQTGHLRIIMEYANMCELYSYI